MGAGDARYKRCRAKDPDAARATARLRSRPRARPRALSRECRQQQPHSARRAQRDRRAYSRGSTRVGVALARRRSWRIDCREEPPRHAPLGNVHRDRAAHPRTGMFAARSGHRIDSQAQGPAHGHGIYLDPGPRVHVPCGSPHRGPSLRGGTRSAARSCWNKLPRHAGYTR